MAKSNKVVAAVVAKSVNPVLAESILAKCEAVAESAIDAEIGIAGITESFQAQFRELCLEARVPVINKDGAEVFDRESEVGKALDKVLKGKATESLKRRSNYNVEVFRVGDDDKFLPVQVWSELLKKWLPLNKSGDVAKDGDDLMEGNHTFTAAFALGVDLKALPGIAEKPLGAKAWLRGNAVGKRPDGKGKGMRDALNNVIDQALSRGWRMDVSGRAGGSRGDFADAVGNLYKVTNKKRNRWERDNQDETVVTDQEWKALCDVIQTAAFDPEIARAMIMAAEEAAASK